MDHQNDLSEAQLADLEDHLADLDSCLAEGDLDGARRSVAAAREIAGDDDADVTYGRALIAWEEGNLGLAAGELRALLEADPDFADAHHTLGLVLDELDDQPGKVHHFVRTLELDARQGEGVQGVDCAVTARIEQVARGVLDGLPDNLRRKLCHVPVLLEDRPDPALVAEGFDPRAFGLFEGPPHGDDAPAPTRIVLYTQNIVAAFGTDDLDDQVEITVLHEVGHYFGLGEEDLADLGLA